MVQPRASGSAIAMGHLFTTSSCGDVASSDLFLFLAEQHQGLSVNRFVLLTPLVGPGLGGADRAGNGVQSDEKARDWR